MLILKEVVEEMKDGMKKEYNNEERKWKTVQEGSHAGRKTGKKARKKGKTWCTL